MARRRIFIVDDEPQIGRLFVNTLVRDGYEARAFVQPQALLDAVVAEGPPDLILSDLMMPEVDGLDLLRTLAARHVSVPVIVMTAHSSVRTAVEAMRLGALHYLQKPVNLEEMRTLIARTLEYSGARQELDELRSAERDRYGVEAFLGESPHAQAVRATLRTLGGAPDATVLVRGETGTGKNLVARILHHTSPRGTGRFLEINCAALPDNLLEAELFGYEKGAFTDARAAKPGLLEVADGGTVFLDEIDSMSPALQAKLLSFLEGRTFRRLGGVDDVTVSTRIVCATNADLAARVEERAFRRDLYYRLHVVTVDLPPLRAMGRDVLLLAHATLRELCASMSRAVGGFEPEAEALLLRHDWPGNVRELRNVVERALIFTNGPRVGQGAVVVTPGPAVPGNGEGFTFPQGQTLEALERAYIEATLRGGTETYAEAAALLGISKKTLWDKRRRYGLDEGKEEG
jgi:two-component system, NtrC family, response regulator AtoC